MLTSLKRAKDDDASALPDLTLAVFHDLGQIKPAWQAFQARANGTLYQSFIWCQAWMETAGKARGVTPCIIVASDQFQQIKAILPLQLRRAWGGTVLEWLGSPHINYGCGLFARDFQPLARAWIDQSWPHILEAAGPFDAAVLRDMPAKLDGIDNPLTGRFNLRAPNKSYAMRLSPDFEALYQKKRSSDDRRSARKKEAGLAKSGAITFGLPKGKTELHAILDTMFKQQESRLAERGVYGVFGPDERSFIHRIADLQDEANPVLAAYHMNCGGETLAVMLGGIHGGTYWALISSLTASTLRKYSPGDLTLRKMIEACCRRGLHTVDFSAGSNRYKESWADGVIQLHDYLGARNLRGLAIAACLAATLVAKRAVKDTPALMWLANGIRRGLRGRQAD